MPDAALNTDVTGVTSDGADNWHRQVSPKETKGLLECLEVINDVIMTPGPPVGVQALWGDDPTSVCINVEDRNDSRRVTTSLDALLSRRIADALSGSMRQIVQLQMPLSVILNLVNAHCDLPLMDDLQVQLSAEDHARVQSIQRLSPTITLHWAKLVDLCVETTPRDIDTVPIPLSEQSMSWICAEDGLRDLIWRITGEGQRKLDIQIKGVDSGRWQEFQSNAYEMLQGVARMLDCTTSEGEIMPDIIREMEDRPLLAQLTEKIEDALATNVHITRIEFLPDTMTLALKHAGDEEPILQESLTWPLTRSPKIAEALRGTLHSVETLHVPLALTLNMLDAGLSAPALTKLGIQMDPENWTLVSDLTKAYGTSALQELAVQDESNGDEAHPAVSPLQRLFGGAKGIENALGSIFNAFSAISAFSMPFVPLKMRRKGLTAGCEGGPVFSTFAPALRDVWVHAGPETAHSPTSYELTLWSTLPNGLPRIINQMSGHKLLESITVQGISYSREAVTVDRILRSLAKEIKVETREGKMVEITQDEKEIQAALQERELWVKCYIR